MKTTSLAAAVQPYVDRQELAGAVMLVADKDQILAVETVGYADVEAGTPMRPDALFWIASMTKPVTATAFMMLVDAGQAEVEAPVAEYLPEFADLWLIAEEDAEHRLLRRPARPLTVADLLSHTSGLPFCTAVEGPTLDALTLQQAAWAYASTPLIYPPGSRYEYSNAGINTVGRIMEVVSGQPYETFLDERLLRPLGMADTTFWPSEAQIARRAGIYQPSEDGTGLRPYDEVRFTYPLSDRHRQPCPAGGLFSTAADCAVFGQMVLNGGEWAGKRYLSAEAVTRMTTLHTDPSWEIGYGLGWGVNEKSFGHGGALSTNLEIYPESGLVTLWLVQHAGYPGAGGEAQAAFKQCALEMWGK